MVSTIRYPSFKQVDWNTRTRFSTFFAVLVVLAFLIIFHEIGLVVTFVGYVLYGIGRHVVVVVRRRRKQSETLGPIAGEIAVNNLDDSSE
jgi:CDP-diacylglycerol--serine O-phosphatidyltransferase